MSERMLVRLQDVADLVALAAEGLTSLFDERQGLFCKRATPGGPGIRRAGVSYEGSLVAVLGLHELTRRGVWTPFDARTLAADLVQARRRVRSSKGVGLLLWMTARVAPDLLPAVYDAFDLRQVVDRYADGRMQESRALSWLLAGLAEIRLQGADAPAVLDDVAHLVRQLLFVNYGGHGVVAGNGRKGLVGGRRGSFADQAFAVYAFSRFGRVYRDDASFDVALRCAQTVAASQDADGAWWWMYEVRSGAAATRYPLLSVHQYALAPMALMEVGQATGADFSEAIRRSLGWVRFGNERNIDLVDVGRKMVWDGLQTPYLRSLKGLVTRSERPPRQQAEVIAECRPAHLGWLLFALSGALGG